MIYFCIFVLVVCTTRFVSDINVVPSPDGFRPFIDCVTIILAIAAIATLT